MLHKKRKLLLDISLSCQEILDFIDGKSFEDFQKNRMLQLAIEREFEIIGEALHRLSQIVEDTLAGKSLSIVKSSTLGILLLMVMILLTKLLCGILP